MNILGDGICYESIDKILNTMKVRNFKVITKEEFNIREGRGPRRMVHCLPLKHNLLDLHF